MFISDGERSIVNLDGLISVGMDAVERESDDWIYWVYFIILYYKDKEIKLVYADNDIRARMFKKLEKMLCES